MTTQEYLISTVVSAAVAVQTCGNAGIKFLSSPVVVRNCRRTLQVFVVLCLAVIALGALTREVWDRFDSWVDWLRESDLEPIDFGEQVDVAIRKSRNSVERVSSRAREMVSSWVQRQQDAAREYCRASARAAKNLVFERLQSAAATCRSVGVSPSILALSKLSE